jgi:hypothetical protein
MAMVVDGRMTVFVDGERLGKRLRAGAEVEGGVRCEVFLRLVQSGVIT